MHRVMPPSAWYIRCVRGGKNKHVPAESCETMIHKANLSETLLHQRYVRGARPLALDFGKQRIGIAVADAAWQNAYPVETLIHTQKTKTTAAIHQLCRDYDTDMLVIGDPRHADGRVSPMSQSCQTFASQLSACYPDLQIFLQNELASTQQARSALGSAGQKALGARKQLDQFAAKEILERFLKRAFEACIGVQYRDDWLLVEALITAGLRDPDLVTPRSSVRDLPWTKQLTDRLEAPNARGLQLWQYHPRAHVAYILLCDWHSRRIMGEHPDIHHVYDVAALRAFDIATARGLSQTPYNDIYLLARLPLLRHEDMGLLDRAARDYEQADRWFQTAHRLRATLAYYGRFPHRNRVLGRQSTAQEKEMLKPYADPWHSFEMTPLEAHETST